MKCLQANCFLIILVLIGTFIPLLKSEPNYHQSSENLIEEFEDFNGDDFEEARPLTKNLIKENLKHNKRRRNLDLDPHDL